VLELGEVLAAYDVRGIAFDRWRIEDLLHVLKDEGIEAPLEPFGQGYKDQGPAIAALEELILNRGLVHGGHPILTWCVSNVVLVSDPAGGRKIDRARAREKVDVAVALAMAVGLYAKAPRPRDYDFSGPMVLTG
jgi:phage terminase large subunit-like protein